MAAQYMSRVDFQGAVSGNQQVGVMFYPNNQATNHAYEYKGPLIAAPGNGDAVVVPPDIQAVSLIFHQTSSGTGHLEVTASPVADVLAGTAIWFTPTGGATLSADTMIQVTAVSAVRIVNASNNTQLMVRAQ